MALTAFEKDEADREVIRDRLGFLEKTLVDHATTPLTQQVEVETHLQDVRTLQEQLNNNHYNMRHHAPKTTDMDHYVQDYYTLLATATRLYNGFHGINSSFPPPATASTAAAATAPPTGATAPQHIRLPKLELKKFSGNLQEWISFRDTFVTAVHSSRLSNVEKLTHLKSLLSGEAERQVRSLILCDANYDIAWKALQDRYENNRELLFSILKRLISQQVLNSSTTQGIRNLVDTTKECVRSLEVLTMPTQHWDAIILYLLFSKLDSASRELWEQSLVDTSIPPLSKMFEFLEQRARALAASNVPTRPPQPRQQQQPLVRNHHPATDSCKFGCSSPHTYWKCPTFKDWSPQQRSDAAKRLHLCFNCLREGHSSTKCNSNGSCKTCNRKHPNGAPPNDPTPPPAVITHHATPVGELRTGVLATANIIVKNSNREFLNRSLVDPGSTNSYITEEVARSMNLQLRSCNIPMTGLSAAPVGTARYITSFTFTSHFTSMFSMSVTALVVKRITSDIPSEALKKDNWPHLRNLQLADPEYHRPNDCHILLGTDVFWSLLENEKIGGSDGQPFAIKTTLGYLVAGPNDTAKSVRIYNTNADLDFQLSRFWEQESLPEKSVFSKEEERCELHYQTTHKRDSTGRFIVSLPFKLPPLEELGVSRQAAVKRFLSMERKFNNSHVKDADLLRKLSNQWSQYKDFMKEYEELGHMRLITTDDSYSTKTTYYIPHHSVMKESSTTTKLRVVFDASAPSSTGKSLNQCMMVGPQLQDTISGIMLRFWIHPIAFTADIAKMYRQILIAPEDTDLQRIVWREHPSLPLRDYRLLTVTYGTTSAPYLAIKCLQQLAHDENERFPKAARVALSDFYVDDAASSCGTLEQARDTVTQLINLCMSGGFELRKWTTNSQELLQQIPEDLRETKSLVELHQDSTIKTLGVFWNPSTDRYSFKLTLPPDMPGKYTKRNILSEIAKIYDPLGWLAPAIYVCKIYMQDLWKVNFDWDDELPSSIQDVWTTIRTSLLDLETIQIPRCVSPAAPTRRFLVGCCDASTKALSAVIYMCCEVDNQPSSCHLLTAKTKVAPVKHVTLPRLELNSAVLLADLLKTTVQSLKLDFSGIIAFTDSMISLHWISSSPNHWKIYIRRRVQSIQDDVPSAEWHHIPGERNPADCASRGITSSDLRQHPLWWNGVPEFFNVRDIPVNLVSDDFTHPI